MTDTLQVVPNPIPAVPDWVDIVVILDRSGSMASIRNDMIGGFNQFLSEQKKVPGKATMSLVRFDHEYEPIYREVPLVEAPDLTPENFVPRGNTALYDAIGRTLVTLMESREKTPASIPDKTLILLITDGEENASLEYTHDRVKELLEECKTKRGWDFVFMGSTEQSLKDAKNLGININVNFAATGVGAKALYNQTSASVRSYRMSNAAYNPNAQQDSDEKN